MRKLSLKEVPQLTQGRMYQDTGLELNSKLRLLPLCEAKDWTRRCQSYGLDLPLHPAKLELLSKIRSVALPFLKPGN